MSLLSAEEQRIIATKHIDAAADVLVLPEVRQALGGYSDRLLEILNWLYVPNVRNGVYETPRRFRDSNRLPLLVLPSQEVAAYDPTHMVTMHPEQAANVRNALDRHGMMIDTTIASEELVSQLEVSAQEERRDEVGRVRAMDGYYGRTDTDWGLYRSYRDFAWVAMRPMIILNAYKPLDDGITLAHEATHADQRMDETLIYDGSINERARVELKPYWVQYTALSAKYRDRLPENYNYIQKREAVRSAANGYGEDAFAMTPKLKKLLRMQPPSSPDRKPKNKHGRVGVKKRR